MKTTFKKQLLVQNVQMDGSINFMTNGDINVYPCPWESDKTVTDGRRIKYRAGIEVDADGRTSVKRYNIGSKGPLHETLYETAHGAVKMTRPMFEATPSGPRRRLDREYVYVTFKFPKKYGRDIIETLYRQEKEQILGFIQSRKEETVWNQQ